MILVFGGTTEGKIVANALEQSGIYYIYSTKTSIDFEKGSYGAYRYGALTSATLISLLQEKEIKVIIHASHPFALELHETINTAASATGISVIRFERSYPARVNHPKVIYLSSYDEAIEYLLTNKLDKLLALTGVQTIVKLKAYWGKCFALFRILPRGSSRAIAESIGFPKEQLIQEMPGDDIEKITGIVSQNQINAIITKESGESGFLSTKVEAALQLNIPILIITRPALPPSFEIVYTKAELLTKLSKVLV